MEYMLFKIVIGFALLIVLTKKNPPAPSNSNIRFNDLSAAAQNTVPAANATGVATDPGQTATPTALQTPAVPPAEPAVVDPDFFAVESEIIKRMIDKEIEANGMKSSNITTGSMQRRKFINVLLFAVISFICVSLYFFHFPTWTYLTEIIVIFIFISINRRYDARDFLYKEVKARPDEKITNIVASLLQENRHDTLFEKGLRLAFIILPFVAAFFIYYEPHLLYEQADTGYHVRFYTIGITNNKEITVPDEYKGKPITGIRGNVFANLRDVRKITLPDTITEIRGNAFRNDYSLEEINLPEDLTYLGANAFYNCHNLIEIVIPKGITEIQGGTFVNCYNLKSVELHDNISYIHGESFINCQSLETINLPSKITEIRGNTFQGCSSLDNIVIPEGVTRIGGHAFEDCSSLSNVTFPSTLREIGSSAFRRCTSLKSVTIPQDTIVAENSFKENYSTKVNYLPTSSPSGQSYSKYEEIYLYTGSDYTIYSNTLGTVE
ncbi:MAG: leucine-rich repeat protein, partial [Bacilli bacterium]|nr:leucine-rich repeat protein [Bacilli bacterium]